MWPVDARHHAAKTCKNEKDQGAALEASKAGTNRGLNRVPLKAQAQVNRSWR